jgi:hypothetical protein
MPPHPTIARLINPNWMPHPDDWEWDRGDAVMQGFGQIWRAETGMANLLWLALDRDKPPQDGYDLRANLTAMRVLTHHRKMRLHGRLLTEYAALDTLPQFRDRLKTVTHTEGSWTSLVRTQLLDSAHRRLAHAVA